MGPGPDPIKHFLASIEATLKFQPIREATIGHVTDFSFSDWSNFSVA